MRTWFEGGATTVKKVGVHTPPLQSVYFGNCKGSPVGLLNDKSREHVGVAKPKSAFDPNAAQVGHFNLLLLGHSSFVVSVYLRDYGFCVALHSGQRGAARSHRQMQFRWKRCPQASCRVVSARGSTGAWPRLTGTP